MYRWENPNLSYEHWAVAVETGTEESMGTKLDLYYGAANCCGGGMMKKFRSALEGNEEALQSYLTMLLPSKYLREQLSPTQSRVTRGEYAATGSSDISKERATLAACIRYNGLTEGNAR